MLWDSRLLYGPGGNTMTADDAGNPSAEAILKQFSEEEDG